LSASLLYLVPAASACLSKWNKAAVTNSNNKPKQARQYIPLPYFIKYSAHTSIMRTSILQGFLAEKKNYFNFKNVLMSLSFPTPHYPLDLMFFLNYLPSIVRSQYFIIIFFFEKCAVC
jgi:hypothetical protein